MIYNSMKYFFYILLAFSILSANDLDKKSSIKDDQSLIKSFDKIEYAYAITINNRINRLSNHLLLCLLFMCEF